MFDTNGEMFFRRDVPKNTKSLNFNQLTKPAAVASAVAIAGVLIIARNIAWRRLQRDTNISSAKCRRSHSKGVEKQSGASAKLDETFFDEMTRFGADYQKIAQILGEEGGLQTERCAGVLAALNKVGSPDDKPSQPIGHQNTRDQGDTFDYESSVSIIKAVMKANLISGDDLLRPNMQKLFVIHRFISSLPTAPLLTSAAVRFTIQFNLFAGTVANLGSPAQQKLLNEEILGSKFDLGSFILTEVGAGVVSGMIVETVAMWQKTEENGAGFKLHCPTPTAVKNWICNGLTARWGIVIARLLLPISDANRNFKKRPAADFDGFLDFGPHAFLVDLHTLDQQGTLERTEMEPRTAFNSLDVASLNFQNAIIPSNSLLSGLSTVSDADGSYTLSSATPFKFELVAQRLLAGRICISGAALGYLHSTIREVRQYKRECPAGRDSTKPLVAIPAIADTLNEAERVHAFLLAYVRIVESQYQTSAEITPRLAESIACAKMVCIEAAIYYVLKIKGAIGSWSLMREAPFGGNLEALYAYKFAEGDTNILVQKVAKDVTTRSGFALPTLLNVVLNPVEASRGYYSALLSLAITMGVKTLRLPAAKKMAVWYNQHRLVKEVAWRHALETIREAVLANNKFLKGSAELVFFDQFAEVMVKTQC